MVDLNMRVFGFSFKDVIGDAPSLYDVRDRLEADFGSAMGDLEGKSRAQLEAILEQYTRAKRELDVRAGSMALSHEKIEVFTGFVSRYVSAVRDRLEKTK